LAEILWDSARGEEEEEEEGRNGWRPRRDLCWEFGASAALV
jgi:hypothetical protein